MEQLYYHWFPRCQEQRIFSPLANLNGRQDPYRFRTYISQGFNTHLVLPRSCGWWYLGLLQRSRSTAWGWEWNARRHLRSSALSWTVHSKPLAFPWPFFPHPFHPGSPRTTSQRPPRGWTRSLAEQNLALSWALNLLLSIHLLLLFLITAAVNGVQMFLLLWITAQINGVQVFPLLSKTAPVNGVSLNALGNLVLVQKAG